MRQMACDWPAHQQVVRRRLNRPLTFAEKVREQSKTVGPMAGAAPGGCGQQLVAGGCCLVTSSIARPLASTRPPHRRWFTATWMTPRARTSSAVSAT